MTSSTWTSGERQHVLCDIDSPQKKRLPARSVLDGPGIDVVERLGAPAAATLLDGMPRLVHDARPIRGGRSVAGVPASPASSASAVDCSPWAARARIACVRASIDLAIESLSHHTIAAPVMT